MSVLTEAKDLEAVFTYFQNQKLDNISRIFLLGASQGGFVSTYVASELKDNIAGLIAFYPAYVLQDDSRKRNPDQENGPETSSIMGMTVGRIYDIDAQSFDIYDKMKDVSVNVLLVHGTDDQIVAVSYSERAEKTFKRAELKAISGAGH